jgi:TRAP-type C4-dicarboxylate transport system substrate-binding protein
MRLSPFALAALAAFTLAGCGGGGGNKAGAGAPMTRVLVFEVPDDGDPSAAVFAAAVARRTHGRVQVRHDLASPFTTAVPANELRLARALERGEVAVGYLPSRAWAVAGIPEFQALLAPFVLSTEQSSQAFAQGPLARAVLQSLPRSVVGLALVPQEPRRILATHPPTSLAAFNGLRIRIVDNPQTAADVTAVGARPVQRLTARQATALLAQHKLDGVESNTTSILNNGYQTFARYFSTYSPFAKFQSIVVSRGAWDALTLDQQAALRAAARDAVASAVRAEPDQEQQELIELCQAEGVPATPTRRQLAAIASAMRSTTPRFVADRGGKELLAQLLRLPGTGLQALASPLPYACLHPLKGAPFVHRGGATIPPGVYRVTDTYKDWLRGHVINPEFRTAITFVTTFRKDGTWHQTQKPNYPDQGPWNGTYTVHGDQMVIVMTHAGPPGRNNSITAPETVQWSYFDGKLTLRALITADPASRVLYEAHPWRKVR